LKTQAPSGGLFGIDQEVVTLRGLSRQLRGVPDRRPWPTWVRRTPILIHRLVCGL